jgi:hypothetical protein
MALRLTKRTKKRIAWTCLLLSGAGSVISMVYRPLILHSIAFSLSAVFFSFVLLGIISEEIFIGISGFGPNTVKKAKRRQLFWAAITGYTIFGLVFFTAGIFLLL